MKCSVYVSLYGRNCQQDETNLLEEVAGKRENVKERGVSERGGDLPVFGQRMRRVGLRRKKKKRSESAENLRTNCNAGDFINKNDTSRV